MISRIRNSRITKIVSLFVLLNFVAEPFLSHRAYGLTSGPNQPEMQGFTPVNTDNMVSLFTGDFNYTIPVMTVPGPNGGYPINLNYSSQIGMEHEASWVGLGWSLNPGAINRQVRGLPDDFKEDKITKTYKQRNNNTIVFTSGGGGEIFSGDMGIGLSLSRSLIYNTYRGLSVGMRFGVAASYARREGVNGKRQKILTGGADVSLDSDNGITSSFSLNGGTKKLKMGANFGYNSKSGAYSFSCQASVVVKHEENKGTDHDEMNIHVGKMGYTFSKKAEMPPVNIPMNTTSFGGSFQGGGAGATLEGYGSISAAGVTQQTLDDPLSFSAFGLLYSEMGTPSDLMDFNREKDICVDESSLNLPLPILTHDIYTIDGELLGGSFRAYRSDWGHVFDNVTQSVSNTTDIGGNAAIASGLQVGGSLSHSYSESSSGDWAHLNENYTPYDKKMVFSNKSQYASSGSFNISPVLYEPFYFKMNGEITANSQSLMDEIGGEDAIAFSIKKNITTSPFELPKDVYTINNKIRFKNGSEKYIYRFQQPERTVRTHNIEYKFGRTNENGRKSHHIAEFTIVNADGDRFTYGDPLYNQLEKEVTFSIPYQGTRLDNSTIQNYNEEYARAETPLRRRVGKEKLYSATETPPYAYSYPLQYITSTDYIDVTGDGPTDDDFGYWVKFNYNKVYAGNRLYRWRFPYSGAHLSLGNLSNQADDKGSYTYGTKEISYVDTITTKTHQAVFYISPRRDGYDANEEYFGGQGSNSLYKLDKIVLYSREDNTVPIQTTYFVYDYSLCQRVENNVDGKGKLTLKEVYTCYENSTKKENHYLLDYSSFNPDYNPVKMDRWGNYKEDADHYDHYVSQFNRSQQDDWSRAWKLEKVTLPSGGTIEVEYESDDYAYVQDKQAMYMAKLHWLTSFRKENGKYYIYFEKDPEVSPHEYVKNFKNNLMLFRVAVYPHPDINNADYVQGYVQINPSSAINVSGTPSIGKVEVLPFDAYDIHPIRFLCLHELKNNRPDILFGGYDARDGESDFEAFFNALCSGGLKTTTEAMFGNDNFYRHCIQKRYSSTMEISKMPSYIRLNKPDKIKVGGGHRVKRLTVNDQWSKTAPALYTREYLYRIIESNKLISSGVAEYEPMVCGEETALRYPVWDQTKGLFFREDEVYSEEPYGETFFPAANVGYSQVIVKSYTPATVNLTASGIQVHQFYTAKDFPIFLEQTSLEVNTNPMPNLLKILTSGFKQTSYSSFSQGYKIELNDMHGKQKSVATYPYMITNSARELAAIPSAAGSISKVEYFYRTGSNSKRLNNNNIPVLLRDDVQVNKTLGRTYDFIVDLRENYAVSIGGGASADVIISANPLPFPLAGAMVYVDSFEELVRSVSTCKVIYKCGILEKTVAVNKGSRITTLNRCWDPYTGAVLLSTVSNDFEMPIYQYNMPAYWYYPNMGNAAENYRAMYEKGWDINFLDDIFMQYDRVNLNGNYVMLKKCDGITAYYWQNDSEQNSSTVSMEVLRSRNSNQLNTMAASIVSLGDPSESRYFPMFETFNKQFKECFNYDDCAGRQQWSRIILKDNRFYFFSFSPDFQKDCQTLTFEELIENYPYVESPEMSNLPYNSNAVDYLFFLNSTNAIVSHRAGRYNSSFPWVDTLNLFPECMNGVLQASAVEMDPDWRYLYRDAGITTLSANREHYLGVRNVYKPLRSNVYVANRKQTGGTPCFKTNVAIDGTFEHFTFFGFDRGNANNVQDPWLWSAEVSLYSPLNYELENRNPLGIYSSGLYGYKNNMTTAVSNNARYCEIGFDSFENDPNTAFSAGRGHLVYNTGTINGNTGHTGKKSLRVDNAVFGSSPFTLRIQCKDDLSTLPDQGVLTLQKGKRYHFSCWVTSSTMKIPIGFAAHTLGYGYVYVLNNGTPVNIVKETPIEGWQRIAFDFTVPENANTEFTLTIRRASGGTFYNFDDIRIMPYNGSMKSYVYDPGNYRLVAELDENNYATFYNYDETGTLVQIKKETERGISTIQTTRQNLKRK